jgi:hypothetical protein
VADTIFAIHSGVRYLVLLAAVVAIVAGLAALRGGRVTGGSRKASAAFTGLLDLQVLLGIATVLTRPFFGQLVGHIVMMVLAAVVAHGFGVALKRRPPERQTAGVQLAGNALALVLIIGGILAIGRPIV